MIHIFSPFCQWVTIITSCAGRFMLSESLLRDAHQRQHQTQRQAKRLPTLLTVCWTGCPRLRTFSPFSASEVCQWCSFLHCLGDTDFYVYASCAYFVAVMVIVPEALIPAPLCLAMSSPWGLVMEMGGLDIKNGNGWAGHKKWPWKWVART